MLLTCTLICCRTKQHWPPGGFHLWYGIPIPRKLHDLLLWWYVYVLTATSGTPMRGGRLASPVSAKPSAPQPSPRILVGGSILPPPPICTRKRLNGPRLDRKTALTFDFQWKPKCKQHLILVDANKTTLKNGGCSSSKRVNFFPFSLTQNLLSHKKFCATPTLLVLQAPDRLKPSLS